jgi:hypothetical protein
VREELHFRKRAVLSDWGQMLVAAAICETVSLESEEISR